MRITGNPASGGKKPGTPTIGTATGGNASATVAYTAPTYVGKGGSVTYRALSTPGSLTGTGASPITVSGLTNGTAYTFQVRAETSYGVLGDYSSASNSTTPAVPTSYESIASVTTTAGQASVTFSSIPSTYRHLEIRGIARDTIAMVVSAGITLEFNNDTGANYAFHYIYGDGTNILADGYTGFNNMQFVTGSMNDTVSANIFGANIISINDYSSTTRNKTVRCFSGSDSNTANTSYRIALNSGLWRNTAAITSIKILPGQSAFNAGSTFALYGVKGA